MRERDVGQAVAVVLQVKGEGGGESRQKYDFPSLFRHGAIDGGEFWVARDFGGHPVACEVAAYEKGGARAEG